MRNEPEKYERLGNLLKGLSEEIRDAGLDARFWERFEREKNIPSTPSFTLQPAPVLAGAILLAATLTFVWVQKDAPNMEIVQGRSILSRAGNNETLRTRQTLRTGDRLATDEDSWAVFAVDKRYRMKLEPGSEVAVERLKRRFFPGKAVFLLVKGKAFVDIDSVKKYPLEIRTMNAFASAMGTQFAVGAPAQAGGSEIWVLKGIVKVGAAGQSGSFVYVKAGQATTVRGENRPDSPRAIAEKTRRELGELFQFSRKNRAVLLVSASPERAEELLSPCFIYIHFDSMTPAAGKLIRVAEELRDSAHRLDPAGAYQTAQELEKTASEQEDMDKTPLLLFTAAYYHFIDHPQEALRLLDRIAGDEAAGSYRSLALMAAALIHHRAADLRESNRLAQEVLTGFPESYEAAAARKLLGETASE